MKIFVSHSDKDAAIYLLLCSSLAAERLDLWDVSAISAGDSLSHRLSEAISECQMCIFIATRRSIKSKWCLAELGAFWGAGKKVILFIADSYVDENSLPPQFKGNARAKTPDDLIKAIKAHRNNKPAPNSFCKPINSRKELYDECRNLIETSNVIRDTTWGQRSPDLVDDEVQARELYRASVSLHIGSNKPYHELLTAEKRNDFLNESLTVKKQFPNYQCRVLDLDISGLSIMDLMIADKNRVLFAYVSARHPTRDVSYVLVESEVVAALFLQFYYEAWDISTDILQYCKENSIIQTVVVSGPDEISDDANAG